MTQDKDISGIPEKYKKYFKKKDMLMPHFIVICISFIIWGLITFILLNANFLTLGLKDDSNFFILLLTFLSFPYIILTYKIYNLYRVKKLDLKPFVPIDFGVCFTPWDDLSSIEKKSNIIGSIDMKCQKLQENYMYFLNTELQNKTNYLVYTIFTLSLLFYPLPKGVPFDKNNYFIKTLMQITMIISLLLLSAPVLMMNRWSSLYLETMFTDLLFMNITNLLLLIAFVIYKIFKK